MNLGINVNNVSHPVGSHVLITSKDNDATCSWCGALVEVNLEPATVVEITERAIKYEFKNPLQCRYNDVIGTYVVNSVQAVHMRLC